MRENQKYCFVAKANCYGLGIKLCREVEDEVDYFAVSSAEEFFALKKLVNKDIIILDPIYENITKCSKLNAILTISNLACLKKMIEELERNDLRAKVYLAVNTGMNRFGFSTLNELEEACVLIKKTQNIVLEGVFSHYYSGNDKISVKKQNEKFNEFYEFIEREFGLNLCCHISATDASLNFGQNSLNCCTLVRIGMGNYTNKFFDTIKLKTTVVEIREVKAGDGAGYGHVFAPKNDCTIAVVAIGYGDGLMRNIVKKGYVLISGEFCKIVASCMDAILVDVTNVGAKIGSEVVVIGKQKKNQIFICDLAAWCDTIEYEIIVRLAGRIKRKIVKEKLCRLSQANIGRGNLLPLKGQAQDQPLQE